jgi:hypothetical protein
MKYRSDKHLVQDMFFPYNLTVLALESIGGKAGEAEANKIRDAMQKYINGLGKSVHNTALRTEQLTLRAIKGAQDRTKLSGHKFILTLHALAELVVEEGVWLPEFIEDLFAPFLEIEHQQEIDEEEWLRLRASAVKQAKKILQKLQGEGYFINAKNNLK